MSYVGYVAGAYGVFLAVLAWDLVVPRLQVRRELRAARERASRVAPAPRTARRTGPRPSR